MSKDLLKRAEDLQFRLKGLHIVPFIDDVPHIRLEAAALIAELSDKLKGDAERLESDNDPYKENWQLRKEVERYQNSQQRSETWRDRAKEEAGYHRNISFDIVWKETLNKAQAAINVIKGDDNDNR